MISGDMRTRCDTNRRFIQACAEGVRDIQFRVCTEEVARPEDAMEAQANAVIAFRHLEDARMRIGNVMQALDGGVSVYDRKPEPESFMERVSRESADLGDKIDKLSKFINGEKFDELPDERKDLLLRQRGAMIDYHQVLCDRVEEYEEGQCSQP